MDFRGGRMSGPPPHNFRPRGGRGNSVINHHSIPSHPHHPPPQGQPPRIFAAPAMNPPQWNAQNPMNHSQPEAHYQQAGYPAEATYNNYTYHPATLPSPELINSTPQPQGFPTFPQQIFPQQQLVYMDPSCYQQQPPIVTTPPAMVPPPPLESNPMRKFHFNSKDNLTQCVSCGHKNILAETEFIKRDERIEGLEKENLVFRKEREALMTEINTLRLKLDALQAEKTQEVEVKLEPQEDVKIEVVESKSELDCEKKSSQLSPDAAEFSPKPSGSVESMTAAVASTTTIDEVPVVSAKGVSDDDGDASTAARGSEAGTQVEECLFEVAAAMEVEEESAPEPEIQPNELSKEDSAGQPTLNRVTSWSDEVDQVTAQDEESSHLESRMEVPTEATEVAAEEKWDDGHQVTSSASTQNWREHPPQNNNQGPDSWQQKNYSRRNNRGHGQNRFNRGGQHHQPAGFGRGRINRNEQDQQYHENYRQNHPHNQGPHRGYHHGNQPPRHQKAPPQTEETWDQPPRESGPRDQGQRFDGRNRNQRYNNRNEQFDQAPQGERENHSRERDNRSRERENRMQERDNRTQERDNRTQERDNRTHEKSFPPKHDEKESHASDTRDRPGRNAWKDNKTNREGSESKDMRESGPQPTQAQAQTAWTGKSNKLFNNEDSKDMTFSKGNQNPQQQSSGNYSYNKGNRPQQHQPKPEVPDVVKELQGDLFSCPGDFSLAHCVAEDFRMGSGIAVKFKEQFKRVGELLDQNVRVGGCAHLHDKESDRYVFYLVTKEVSIGKPKMDSLQESLRALKAKCLKFEVKKLAMPRIGCGLDRLDWSRVKASINETFHDTDIEVRVYDFNVSPHYYKRKNQLWNNNPGWYNDYGENYYGFYNRTSQAHYKNYDFSWLYALDAERAPKSKSNEQDEVENWDLSGIFTLDAEKDPEQERYEIAKNVDHTNMRKTHEKGRKIKEKVFKSCSEKCGKNMKSKNEYDRFDIKTYDSFNYKEQGNKTASEIDNCLKGKVKCEPKSDEDLQKSNLGKHIKKEKNDISESDENSQTVLTLSKVKKHKKKSKSKYDKDEQKNKPSNKVVKNKNEYEFGSDKSNYDSKILKKGKKQKKKPRTENYEDEQSAKYTDKDIKKEINYESESDDSNHNIKNSNKVKKHKNKCKTKSCENEQNAKYSDMVKTKENKFEYENNRIETSEKVKKRKKNCKAEVDEDEQNTRYSNKSKKENEMDKPVSESDVKDEQIDKYSNKVKKRKRSKSKLASEEDNPINECSDKTKKHKKKKKRKKRFDEKQVEKEPTPSHSKSYSTHDSTDEMPDIPHKEFLKKQSDSNVNHSKWKVSTVGDEKSSSARRVQDKSDN